MSGTITHEWNGTVLTITSDSGTSSSDLKGAKGDDGIRGAQGIPGSGYTLTEGDMATIMQLVMDNISQDASGIGYSDSNNLGVDNVQDAIDAAFQLGTNRHAELVSSLEFSNLGITEESTWDEIFDALERKFPDAVYDLLSVWSTDGLNLGTSSTTVTRNEEDITLTGHYADEGTRYCETTSIPIGEYENMKIVGTASCTAGAMAYSPTLTISSNGVTLDSITVPNGGSIDFAINAASAEHLKVTIVGCYQTVSVTFNINLNNTGNGEGGDEPGSGDEPESGSAALEEFWEDFNSDRTLWDYAFYGWGNKYLEPTLQLAPTSTMQTFYQCVNLRELKSEYFDFSNATPIVDNSNNGNNRTFYKCSSLEKIEDIGLPAGYYARTFDSCTSLKEIDVLRVTPNTGFGNAFNGCSALEEIYSIEGTIGQNGLSFANSPNLSYETIKRIVNALADYTNTTGHSVTFHKTSLNKLSAAEIAEAAQRGWDLGA